MLMYLFLDQKRTMKEAEAMRQSELQRLEWLENVLQAAMQEFQSSKREEWHWVIVDPFEVVVASRYSQDWIPPADGWDKGIKLAIGSQDEEKMVEWFASKVYLVELPGNDSCTGFYYYQALTNTMPKFALPSGTARLEYDSIGQDWRLMAGLACLSSCRSQDRQPPTDGWDGGCTVMMMDANSTKVQARETESTPSQAREAAAAAPTPMTPTPAGVEPTVGASPPPPEKAVLPSEGIEKMVFYVWFAGAEDQKTLWSLTGRYSFSEWGDGERGPRKPFYIQKEDREGNPVAPEVAGHIRYEYGGRPRYVLCKCAPKFFPVSCSFSEGDVPPTTSEAASPDTRWTERIELYSEEQWAAWLSSEAAAPETAAAAPAPPLAAEPPAAAPALATEAQAARGPLAFKGVYLWLPDDECDTALWAVCGEYAFAAFDGDRPVYVQQTAAQPDGSCLPVAVASAGKLVFASGAAGAASSWRLLDSEGAAVAVAERSAEADVPPLQGWSHRYKLYHDKDKWLAGG